MVTKHLLSVISACCLSMASLHASSSHILEAFTVSVKDVEVRQCNATSIQFKSDTSAYAIKLEPNKEGRVIFGISGIGYRSTAKLSNLLFGVKITGYRDTREIHPTFSFDDVNSQMHVEENMIIFPTIYGSLAVWFDQAVDSIMLEFSNSHSLNMDQYFGIQDLKVIPEMAIHSNPEIDPCAQNHVMIAIDGSSSIDKNERTLIGNQLLDFVRQSSFARDSHQLCIVEYGTEIFSRVESSERRDLVKTLLRYRKDKNNKSKYTSWTNWSAAFEEALDKKPEVLIFITDGWSNWKGQSPCTFSAQYETLVSQSNQLKAQGTHLLFLTSDIDNQKNSRSVLSNFLNNDQTVEVREFELTRQTDLKTVDLITLQSFEAMSEINFSSLLFCPPETPEVIPTEDLPGVVQGAR